MPPSPLCLDIYSVLFYCSWSEKNPLVSSAMLNTSESKSLIHNALRPLSFTAPDCPTQPIRPVNGDRKVGSQTERKEKTEGNEG